jgi:hypothetical protein
MDSLYLEADSEFRVETESIVYERRAKLTHVQVVENLFIPYEVWNSAVKSIGYRNLDALIEWALENPPT